MTDMLGSQSGPHPNQRQHVHEELIAKIDSVPLPLPDGASAITPQFTEGAEYRTTTPNITSTTPSESLTGHFETITSVVPTSTTTTEATPSTRYKTSDVVLPRIPTRSTRYVRSDGELPAETTTTVVPETSTTAETAHPTRYVKASVVLPRITTSTRYEASGETPPQTK